MQEDNFDDLSYDQQSSDESFHIEVDFYDTGDLSGMLVIPCNDAFIIVANDEHLCTLIHTCKEIECWEQQEGTLDDDLVERIGAAIQGARPELFNNDEQGWESEG